MGARKLIALAIAHDVMKRHLRLNGLAPPSQGGSPYAAHFPRALPWAGFLRAVGA
jgi:hypothetical protein